MSPELREQRLGLTLALERMGLLVRYALALMSVVAAFGFEPEATHVRLLWVLIAIGLQNIFTHWVLAKRRYELFYTWTNLAMHFLVFSTLVALDMTRNGEFYVLYLFFLIGLNAYIRRGYQMALAIAICCGMYAAIFLLVPRSASEDGYGRILMDRLVILVLSGATTGFLGARLRRAEAASTARTEDLESSESVLRMIINSAPVPMFIIDNKQTIKAVNESACLFLKEERDALLDHSFKSFLFDDGSLASKVAVIRSTGEYHGDEIIVRSDGEERTVEFHARAYFHEDGAFAVVAMHDITTHRNAQQAASAANTQLERLNRELHQVNALKTDFLSTISQQLRSPMCAMLGYAELLLSEDLGELTEEQRNAVQVQRRCALRAFRLMDQALAVGDAATAGVVKPQDERFGDA